MTNIKDIKQFTGTNLKQVRKEIETKLEELKALGLDVSIGNISYDDTKFTTKMTVSLASAGDIYEQEFKSKCDYFGMKEDLVGTTFTLRGKEYVFRGFRPNARTKRALFHKVGEEDTLYRNDVDIIKEAMGV